MIQVTVRCGDLYAEEDEDAWKAEMSDLAGREACRRHWLGLMNAAATRLTAVRGGRAANCISSNSGKHP
jgi:hypothetical protein